MKVLTTPRLSDKAAVMTTIILLGIIAFTILRMMIGLFCDFVARPLFLGL